ncbi:Cof-type HAD-IIB family hydrolase [Dermatobacter hominis]|uniref:Cof-type HAD-IIB family hydrolase n=1 Tax=Dermatobacter hominis TaxID=2884263 RepID=UPI001D1189B7|nr:HAD family hydrolase [Dermatobacter hominis]UDY35680.1 Cof-type HAD-IIB family hydrolase [Dermatobacter hominis]
MTPRSVRLIACDMDGTLLGADGLVSARNGAALAAARDAGIAVAVATGRSHQTALRRLGDATAIEWAICSNGALEMEVATRRTTRVDPLPAAVVDDVVAELAALDGVAYAWEDVELGLRCSPEFLRRHPSIESVVVDEVPAPTYPSGPQIKIMVSLADRVRLAAVEAVSPLLPDGVEVATSGSLFTELTAHGVDKAFGVAHLADRLGIDRSEVLAFGDNHNDVPMLRWAGTAVAMGNADPTALAVTTERTLRHDEDGVAAYVEAVLDRKPGGDDLDPATILP